MIFRFWNFGDVSLSPDYFLGLLSELYSLQLDTRRLPVKFQDRRYYRIYPGPKKCKKIVAQKFWIFMFWLLVPLQLTPECFFEKFSTFNLGSLTTGVHMFRFADRRRYRNLPRAQKVQKNIQKKLDF